MTSESLITDIIDPQRQLVGYANGNQSVGFYDGFKPGKIDTVTGEVERASTPTLYIYIKNNNDKFTVVRRAAGSKRPRPNQPFVEETKLYARAYARYLEMKSTGSIVDPEKRRLEEKIARLEAEVASSKKSSAEPKAPKEELPSEGESTPKKTTSAKELKEELDELGVEYKGNASKEALQELLATNKE
jgi:hypothetical protein